MAITASPQSESIDGAWTMEGDAISAVLTVESEEVTWNLTYEGDQLTMDQNGQFETFRREEDEAYAPAEPVIAEEADFAGRWTAVKIGMGDAWVDPAMVGMDLAVEFNLIGILLSGFQDEDAILPVTFADGAYTYSAESEEAEVGSLTAQMLEDGSLQLTMTAGETASTLILTPVEAE